MVSVLDIEVGCAALDFLAGDLVDSGFGTGFEVVLVGVGSETGMIADLVDFEADIAVDSAVVSVDLETDFAVVFADFEVDSAVASVDLGTGMAVAD